MRKTRLVASTKLGERDFWSRSPLGRSLLAMPHPLRPELRLRFDNHGEIGLPAIYNRAIECCPDGMALLFVHDDVWIHDAFLEHRLDEGLRRADIVGLAGSRNSSPSHPSWGLSFDEELRPTGWQHGGGLSLSGAVSHGLPSADRPPVVQLGIYGAFPAECDLLDGLLLACRSERLKETGTRFDERFTFHLYDLDFCRSSKANGLSLSTWPILVTHASGGNFGSDEFRTAARAYLEKWSPTPLPEAS